MTESTLTYPDRLLLQRLHDADVTLDAQERAKAEQLLASQELARQFVEGLAEVHTAAKAAEGEVWALAPERTAAVMAQAAFDALELKQWPLEHLMPMLERIHDGEADEADLTVFERLLETREDVADYMAVLDESRHSVIFGHEQALEQVNFGQFWSSLEARLDITEQEAPTPPKQAQLVSFPRQPATAERPSFDLKEHQLMLGRFFDGESSADESSQVQAWLEIDPTASTTLAVMEELSLAVQGAVDELQERAQLAQIWSGVEAVIDAEREGKVVSFERAREAKAKPSSGAGSLWAKLPKRELIAAAAAALFTVAGIGMFADKIFDKEPVIVERTVVIVDSVEYSSGSSGMVVQPASMGLERQANDAKPQPADSAAQDSQEEASPTIIWLLDDDEAQAAPAQAPQEPEASPTQTPDQGQPI